MTIDEIMDALISERLTIDEISLTIVKDDNIRNVMLETLTNLICFFIQNFYFSQ
jgi:hypothetical protein